MHSSQPQPLHSVVHSPKMKRVRVLSMGRIIPYASPPSGIARSTSLLPVQEERPDKDRLYRPPEFSKRVLPKAGKYPHACGGLADVWKAELHEGLKSVEVAVKVIRPIVKTEDERKRLNKKLRREIQVWKRLHHKNIAPLLGITSSLGTSSDLASSFGPPPCIGLVSPWMSQGNLNEFVKREALTMRRKLDLLYGVAVGLSYLHSKGIIHGDLTGANVLINDKCEPVLTDFGLSYLKVEFEDNSYWSSTTGGAIRWRAPELLSDDAILTDKCDIYSFGCIMFQTLSGRFPYWHIRKDLRVVVEKFKGIHPRRPPHPEFDERLWQLIVQCWNQLPESRPTINHIQCRIMAFQRDDHISAFATL